MRHGTRISEAFEFQMIAALPMRLQVLLARRHAAVQAACAAAMEPVVETEELV